MDDLPPHHLKIAFELGLLSRDEVVALADKALAAPEKPSQWILSISSAPSQLSRYDFIRLLPEGDEPSDEEFIALCAYGWSKGLFDPKRIGGLLYDRFCLKAGEMTPLRQQIYVYDDELGWDVNRAMSTLQGILVPFSAQGERLMARLKP